MGHITHIIAQGLTMYSTMELIHGKPTKDCFGKRFVKRFQERKKKRKKVSTTISGPLGIKPDHYQSQVFCLGSIDRQ